MHYICDTLDISKTEEWYFGTTVSDNIWHWVGMCSYCIYSFWITQMY